MTRPSTMVSRSASLAAFVALLLLATGFIGAPIRALGEASTCAQGTCFSCPGATCYPYEGHPGDPHRCFSTGKSADCCGG